MSGPRLRIAVFGGSNCILHASFVRLLGDEFGHVIHNYSVGGCPNIAQLYGMAKAGDLIDDRAPDVVLVEPAINDHGFIECGAYTMEALTENFEVFLAQAWERWPGARVVLVLIPRLGEVIAEADTPVLLAYRALASRHGLEVLHLAPAMRAEAAAQPAAIHLMFKDHLHLSNWMARRVALSLDVHLARAAPPPDAVAGPVLRSRLLPTSRTVPPDLPASTRMSSLCTETFVRLRDGERAAFESGVDGRLIGLVFNRYTSSGYLRVSGPNGHVWRDLRMTATIGDHIGVICSPLVRQLGGRSFEVIVSRAPPPEGETMERNFEGLDGDALGEVELAGVVFLDGPPPVEPGLLGDPDGFAAVALLPLDVLDPRTSLAADFEDAYADIARVFAAWGETTQSRPRNHMLCAFLFRSSHRLDDAVVQDRLAVLLAPDDAEARGLLEADELARQARRRAENPEAARREARDLVQAAPGDLSHRRREAALLVELGDPAAARAAVMALLDDGFDADVVVASMLAVGHQAGAVRPLLSDPNPLEPLKRLAARLLRDGRLDAAHDAAAAVQHVNPRDALTAEIMSLIAERRGDLDGALRWQRSAMTNLPAEPRVRARLLKLLLESAGEPISSGG